MKKLIVLMMVLGMASAAVAIPYFEVDAADKKDHYSPSDWITINLVDDGLVTGFMIDCITDNPLGAAIGMAGEPQVFNAGFGYQWPGVLNSEGQLVAWVQASVNTVPEIPVSGILYSFEYHVPDVQASTLIPIMSYISDDYVSEIHYIDGSDCVELICGLVIHVPEPTTIALLGLGGLLLRRRR